MNVHIGQAPALDSAETVPAPIVTPTTLEQDWSRLVTPGHVLRSRLMCGAAVSLALAWGAAAVVFVVASLGPDLAALKMPPSFYLTALVNPATWVKMPDGSLTSYRLEWLSKIPAQGGLPAASWTAFVKAVREDVSNHGAEYSAWQSVPGLGTAPRIHDQEIAVVDPGVSHGVAVYFPEEGRGRVPDKEPRQVYRLVEEVVCRRREARAEAVQEERNGDFRSDRQSRQHVQRPPVESVRRNKART